MMFVIKVQSSKLPILFCTLVFGCLVHSGQQAEAQLLKQVRSEYGSNTQIQYAPDDPSTRSRLFNLHTGHAGAFYNCDGEEDKRHSPYICWKSGNGDCHRTFWDVLQWKRDRDDVVQRICDGAGACCGSENCSSCQQSQVVEFVEPQGTCGCANCAAAKNPNPATSVSLKQRAVASSSAINRLSRAMQPKTNFAGLVETDDAVRSVVDSRAVVKEAPCNCVTCRTKRQRESGATQVTQKTASLLDRAKSSRQQR